MLLLVSGNHAAMSRNSVAKKYSAGNSGPAHGLNRDTPDQFHPGLNKPLRYRRYSRPPESSRPKKAWIMYALTRTKRLYTTSSGGQTTSRSEVMQWRISAGIGVRSWFMLSDSS